MSVLPRVRALFVLSHDFLIIRGRIRSFHIQDGKAAVVLQILKMGPPQRSTKVHTGPSSARLQAINERRKKAERPSLGQPKISLAIARWLRRRPHLCPHRRRRDALSKPGA